MQVSFKKGFILIHEWGKGKRELWIATNGWRYFKIKFSWSFPKDECLRNDFCISLGFISFHIWWE